MERLTKQLLREKAKQQRKALTPEEISLFNKGLLNQFSELSFSKIRHLHTFLPIAGRREPDSLLLISWLRREHPGINIVISKSNFEQASMQHYVWDENTLMYRSKQGITEPAGGSGVPSAELDMVLVPLLAFDTKGNRVGYGGGFYDRFLNQCRPDAIKIGLSFFKPVELISDVSPHDIPLNACITPERTWRFTGV